MVQTTPFHFRPGEDRQVYRQIYRGSFALVACALIGCAAKQSTVVTSTLGPAPEPPLAHAFGAIPTSLAGTWLVVLHSKPLLDLTKALPPDPSRPPLPPPNERVVNSFETLRIARSNAEWRIERLATIVAPELGDANQNTNARLVPLVPTADQLRAQAAAIAKAAPLPQPPRRIQLYTPGAPTPPFAKINQPDVQLTLGFLYGPDADQIATGWSLQFVSLAHDRMSGRFDSSSIGRDVHGLPLLAPTGTTGQFDMYRLQ